MKKYLFLYCVNIIQYFDITLILCWLKYYFIVLLNWTNVNMRYTTAKCVFILIVVYTQELAGNFLLLPQLFMTILLITRLFYCFIELVCVKLPRQRRHACNIHNMAVEVDFETCLCLEEERNPFGCHGELLKLLIPINTCLIINVLVNACHCYIIDYAKTLKFQFANIFTSK